MTLHCRIRFAVFSVFAGVGVGLGCTMSTSFSCSSDDQCIAAGIEGVCAEAGYCAFPDGECAGGFAYGQHAGEGLARRPGEGLGVDLDSRPGSEE